MTPNEQKQQLSVAYVHAIAARAGFTSQVQHVDIDSVDLMLGASGMIHERSVLKSPRLAVQLKATSSPKLRRDRLDFPLPIKNYNDLRGETLVPVILIVLVLPADSEGWLEVTEDAMISRRCAYWLSLRGKPEVANKASVTVHLPRTNLFSVDQLQILMARISRKEEP